MLITAQAAPVLFTDFKDAPRELDEFTGKGKWTVVMIWASDCHYCDQEAGDYVKFNDNGNNINTRVVGISLDGMDGKAAAEGFIKKHKIDFPNLLGEYDHVTRWFEYMTGENWVGTPTILIYTPSGELRAQQAGAVPVKLIKKFIQREAKAEKSKLGMAH